MSVSIQYLAEKRKRENNSKILNSFAYPEEKLVLQIVLDLSEKKRHITAHDIIENMRKKHGKHLISSEKVLNILSVLNQYGLIHRMLVSVENTPVAVWKA